MQTIQADKFKAEFSAILEQIQNTGEKFVFEYGETAQKGRYVSPLWRWNKKSVYLGNKREKLLRLIILVMKMRRSMRCFLESVNKKFEMYECELLVT